LSKQDNTLDLRFMQKVLEGIQEAETQFGVKQPRLKSQVEQFGAVSCVKEMLKKGRTSDGFLPLSQVGGLACSLESLVCETIYGQLFSDEEVNDCFAALCEAGHYGGAPHI